jgi:hypothetical protein
MRDDRCLVGVGALDSARPQHGHEPLVDASREILVTRLARRQATRRCNPSVRLIDPRRAAGQPFERHLQRRVMCRIRASGGQHQVAKIVA